MKYVPLFSDREDKLRTYDTPMPYDFSLAYLLGAMHDGTKRIYTYRICQASKDYITLLCDGIKSLGFKAWTYKEGEDRNLYVVEFSKRILENIVLTTEGNFCSYVHGYFDTDGSVPSIDSRYYIYFSQKNKDDITRLMDILLKLEIKCGKLHNPSIRVDPDYYRFYVLAKSYNDFAYKIGSLHPEKRKRLRIKI